LRCCTCPKWIVRCCYLRQVMPTWFPAAPAKEVKAVPQHLTSYLRIHCLFEFLCSLPPSRGVPQAIHNHLASGLPCGMASTMTGRSFAFLLQEAAACLAGGLILCKPTRSIKVQAHTASIDNWWRKPGTPGCHLCCTIKSCLHRRGNPIKGSARSFVTIFVIWLLDRKQKMLQATRGIHMLTHVPMS
jgi:hypothetical protein